MANPNLPEERRNVLVRELMDARRKVATTRRGDDPDGEAEAHAAVDRTKLTLGERGPVWWDGDVPDLNRHMVRTTPYAEWFATLRRSEQS